MRYELECSVPILHSDDNEGLSNIMYICISYNRLLITSRSMDDITSVSSQASKAPKYLVGDPHFASGKLPTPPKKVKEHDHLPTSSSKTTFFWGGDVLNLRVTDIFC